MSKLALPKDGLPIAIGNAGEAARIFGAVRCKATDLLFIRYENDYGSASYDAAAWLADRLKEITHARVIVIPPGFAIDHMTKKEFERLAT